jgi:hypothetical protein
LTEADKRNFVLGITKAKVNEIHQK